MSSAFVSYAQNFEDVMLWRCLKDVEKGFYIDVGANDPVVGSVTKGFYDAGWNGINIEPASQWFEKLQNERPKNINLQMAAGAEQGRVQFYEIPDTGLSTLDKVLADHHKNDLGFKVVESTVLIDTLSKMISQHHKGSIHFLKIDVEGSEEQVIQGIDFSIMRPWIIVVESTLPLTQVESFKGWEPILFSAGYDCVYFDGLNRFYVANEHIEIKEKFNSPPNIWDDFVLSETTSYCCRSFKLVIQAESSLKAVKASLSEQLSCSEGLKIELDTTKASLSEQLSCSEGLKIELAAVMVKNDSLEHSLSLSRVKTDKLTRELMNIYSSKFWRATWSLRKLMQYLKVILTLPISCWLVRLPRRAASLMIVRFFSFVLRYSTLKPYALAWLGQHDRVRCLIQARGLIRMDYSNLPIITAQTVTKVEPKMTQIERRIYNSIIFRKGDEK